MCETAITDKLWVPVIPKTNTNLDNAQAYFCVQRQKVCPINLCMLFIILCNHKLT